MRTTCSILAFLALAAPAFAAEIDADSLVSAATVYPQGALVTRTVRFSAGAGENQIIVDDLPLNFDATSLRVSGAADGVLNIVSVDHRVSRLPPQPEQTSPERTRLEAAIKALDDQMRAVDRENRLIAADIEAARARQRFAETLMQREPQAMVDDVEHLRAGPEAWVPVIGLLADETAKALRAIAEAEGKIEDNQRRVDDLNEDRYTLEQQLYALDLPLPERSVATISITSDAAISGTLDLTYQVAAAGWEPIYDLRLTQGAEASLAVERHARVSQQTGEDWSRIALTLSTARPSGRMEAPDLPELRATIYDPMVVGAVDADATAMADMPAPAAMAPEMNVVQEAMLREDMAGGVAPEPVPAGLVGAISELQGQTVVYKLPASADISGDGTVRQLAIDQGTLKAGLLARTAPEFDSNAYLYAAAVNTFAGPLLPGRAKVFRDGTFVGETALALVAPGKNVVLPFGVLDGLTVSRHVLEKTDGDFGLIGTTNQRRESYEITVDSVLSYPLPVTVYDRAPYTEQEDLEVTVTATPEPSVTDLDGKRGVRNWTFDLQPGAKQVIKFAYDITWPGDKEMQVQ